MDFQHFIDKTQAFFFFLYRIMSRNFLSKNDELRKGDYLISNNREFKAVFQVSNSEYWCTQDTYRDAWYMYTELYKSVWKMHILITVNCLCFCLQDDGNFVVYGWKPVWASDTAGSDVVRLCMQADCNLVMYNKDSEPRWHTNTAKSSCNMCRLHLTDDGKLEVNRECDGIWSSANSTGMK